MVEKRITVKRGTLATVAGKVLVLNTLDDMDCLIESLTLSDLVPEDARRTSLGDTEAAIGSFEILVRFRPEAP